MKTRWYDRWAFALLAAAGWLAAGMIRIEAAGGPPVPAAPEPLPPPAAAMVADPMAPTLYPPGAMGYGGGGYSGGGYGGVAIGAGSPYGFPGPGPGEARPGPVELVFLESQPDPDREQTCRQQLQVMGRILQKRAFAVQAGTAGVPMEYRMGIVLAVNPEDAGVRTLYVEGLGAVFFLRVGYPLAGAADTGSGGAAQAAETPGSEWDQTRRELYGPRPGIGMMMAPGGYPGALPVLSFDPNRAAELKRQIIDALASASNLDLLAADESILVVVKGPAAAVGAGAPVPGAMGMGAGEPYGAMAGGGMGGGWMGGSGMAMSLDPGAGETVMTLRVRKGDLARLPDSVEVNSYRTAGGGDGSPVF